MVCFTFDSAVQARLVASLNREEQFKDAIKDFMGMCVQDNALKLIDKLKAMEAKEKSKPVGPEKPSEARAKKKAPKKRGEAK
jgi:hypothetical protein